MVAGLVSTPQALAELEEIVVTAQKRAESVQDVPISIQAFSGENLNGMGVQTATDITALAPNMNVSTQTPVTQTINIRGGGTNDFFSNSSGSVGVYMDEVTMSAPALGGLGLFDIERIEVLRGPQNSLFGRNITGGAVNKCHRRPSPELPPTTKVTRSLSSTWAGQGLLPMISLC